MHRAAAKALTDHLYQRQRLEVFELPLLKLVGEPGETRDAFLARARLAARERRDAEIDKLNRAMQTKLTRLETKLQSEQRELAGDQAELEARKREEMLSAGESLLGMFGVLGPQARAGAGHCGAQATDDRAGGRGHRRIAGQIVAVSAELEQIACAAAGRCGGHPCAMGRGAGRRRRAASWRRGARTCGSRSAGFCGGRPTPDRLSADEPRKRRGHRHRPSWRPPANCAKRWTAAAFRSRWPTSTTRWITPGRCTNSTCGAGAPPRDACCCWA